MIVFGYYIKPMLSVLFLRNLSSKYRLLQSFRSFSMILNSNFFNLNQITSTFRFHSTTLRFFSTNPTHPIVMESNSLLTPPPTDSQEKQAISVNVLLEKYLKANQLKDAVKLLHSHDTIQPETKNLDDLCLKILNQEDLRITKMFVVLSLNTKWHWTLKFSNNLALAVLKLNQVNLASKLIERLTRMGIPIHQSTNELFNKFLSQKSEISNTNNTNQSVDSTQSKEELASVFDQLKIDQLPPFKTLQNQLKSLYFNFNVINMCEILSKYIKINDANSIQLILNQMNLENIQPNQQFYEILINYYANNQQIENAEKLLFEMVKNKIQLNLNIIQPIMNGYSQRKTLPVIKEVTEKLIKDEYPWAAFVFRLFLEIPKFTKPISDAFYAFIQEVRIENEENLNVLFEWWLKSIEQSFQKTSQIALLIETYGIKPSEEIFRNLMENFAVSRSHNRFLAVLELKLKYNNEPTDLDLFQLAEIFNERTKNEVDQVVQLLLNYRVDYVIKFYEYLFQKDNSLIQSHWETIFPIYTQVGKFEKALSIFRQVQDLNAINFFYESMKTKAIQGDLDSFNFLLFFYNGFGRLEEAQSLVDVFITKKFTVNQMTYQLILDLSIKQKNMEQFTMISICLEKQFPSIDDETANFFIGILISLQEYNLAFELLKQVKDSIKIDQFVFYSIHLQNQNLLLKNQSENLPLKPNQFLEQLKELVEFDQVLFDCDFFSKLIESYAMRNDIDRMIQLISNNTSDQTKLDLNTYEKLISLFILNSYTAAVKNLTEIKRKQKIKWDLTVYKTLFKFYASQDDLQMIWNSFEDLSDDDLIPDANIFEILIDFFAKRKEFDNVVMLMSRMKDGDIKPNINSYNQLLKYYIETKAEQNLNELLNEISITEFNHQTFEMVIEWYFEKKKYNEMKRYFTLLKRQRVPSDNICDMMKAMDPTFGKGQNND